MDESKSVPTASNQNLFFEEERLLLFKAVQAGEEKKVRELLLKTPTLISAKTTSGGASLLHIAAANDHESICQLLLDNKHETNPVNNAGQTPYQRTKSDKIKQLLVACHVNALCGKFATAKDIDPQIKYKVMSRENFEKFLSENGAGEMSTRAFGMTLPGFFYNDTNIFLKLEITFREDILMTPYYGDLLVIHENEQAIQSLELLKKFNQQKIPLEERNEMIEKITATLAPMFEARSFLKFVSKGLEMFPFLKDYPQKNDTFDIKEAKKLFIVFGLGGLCQYMQECSREQHRQLEILPYFRPAILHAEKIVSSENAAINLPLMDEMEKKYTSSVLNLSAGNTLK